MKEKKVFYSRGAALAFGLLIVVLLISAPAAAKTWDAYEGDNLRDLIENKIEAEDGLFVHSGIYNITKTNDCIHIRKQNITIQGEDEENTILDFSTIGNGVLVGFYEPAYNCTIDHLQFVVYSVGFGENANNGVIKRCIIKGSGVTFGCSNCTADGNLFDGCPYAVQIPRGVKNTIFRNNLVYNSNHKYYSIWLKGNNTLIENNTVQGSKAAGVSIEYAENCTITGNTFDSCGYCGIELYKVGENNRLYLNSITDCGKTATTSGTASPANIYWISPTPLSYTYNDTSYTGYVGNYWSDYTGTDEDGDGIGDTPYELPDGLGNDTAPLIATPDQYSFTGSGPEPSGVGLSFTPNPTEAGAGGVAKVSIMLDELPAGLAGYNLTVKLDDSSVAEISAVSFPEWAGLSATGNLPSGEVWIKAADEGEAIQSGAANVTLATLTVISKASGTSNISAIVKQMDADDGDIIETSITKGQITVSSQPVFPGCDNPPHDLNSDGIYEDVNGNGLFDFADIVTFFNEIEWSIDNEPVEAFDVNDNGRIDFADLVGLYKAL